MRRIARLGVRYPRPALTAWVLAFIVALFFANSARDNLHETNLQIPGTPAERAAKVTERQFGGTISMAILLKGPPRLVEEEGPRLVRRLSRIEGVQVLSPWATGGDRTLREPAGEALLTLQVQRPFAEISAETTPAVQAELRRSIHEPLKVEISGLAPLVRAINEASLDSLDRGERIALPILVILLLVVFRTPLAALVPLLAGLFATRIGTAVMGAVNTTIEVDALALNMVTMIGLALGVDYSLLIVSRFREELARGLDRDAAVEESIARAGRTVVFAGTALATGMLGALLIAPGALLVSATMGVIVATLLAVLLALFAMPAGLTLLGTNINRWQFGRAAAENPFIRLSQRALRRPGAAAFFVLLPLLVLSTPAIALDTGPPNVANLPPGNAERKSYEAFQRDRGAGWATPFEITFRTRGPITTTKRLRALKRFQNRVSRHPGIDAVLGPAALLDRTAVLRSLTRNIASGNRELLRLERALRRLKRGTGTLRDGLVVAAGGSDALASGLGDAAAGSDQIAQAISSAAPDTKALAQGVADTEAGSKKVTAGSAEAEAGAKELADAMEELSKALDDENSSSEKKLTEPLDDAQSAVQAALRHLGDVSATAAADPSVQKAKTEVQNALAELAPLKSNLTDFTTELDTNALASSEILKGTEKLAAGLDDLTTGSDTLDSGIAETSAGAALLAGGVDVLSAGSFDLRNGLFRLLGGGGAPAGARELAAGLNDALSGSNRIGRGLQRLFDRVVEVRRTSDTQAESLRRNGTDVDRAAASGYFILAGVEGAAPQTQTNVAFATNAARGGNTARVMVVPKAGPFDPETAALRPLLESDTRATAEKLGAQGLVGGPAVLLDDFDRATSSRFPFLVVVLVLVTFLVLMLVFRAPLLALMAVLLNLVTVGAAVGVLILLFQTDPPILGGPGYLDAIALSGIFAIIFGLSIDYEVFLISRLVEGRALTGTTDGAIRYGLEKTTTIITGAAAIMMGVFLAFAASPVTNTRQFGIGLAVAVALDATVIRLILLPALIRLFGERTWAVPSWLDRILPRFSTH